MKAGIIGAGALGLLFSHSFHEHMIDFVIYEVNKEIVDDIKKNGINLLSDGISKNISPVIDSSPEILYDSDIIFLFVKSYSTLDAITNIKDHINENSIIVSLQNGLGNAREIKKFIDIDRIVYGSTTIGAAKSSFSTVIAGGSGIISIGGADKKNIMKVDSLFKESGFDSHIIDDPDSVVWKKAIINAGINPLAAVLKIPNGKILSNQYALTLQENIIKEAVDAAIANNIEIKFDEILQRTKDVCEKTSTNLCSMLQDIQSGRKTEIESINGEIIEYGEKKGLNMQFNKTLYLLIKSMANTK
jgi:2-dehydropantoate 2-reductase